MKWVVIPRCLQQVALRLRCGYPVGWTSLPLRLAEIAAFTHTSEIKGGFRTRCGSDYGGVAQCGTGCPGVSGPDASFPPLCCILSRIYIFLLELYDPICIFPIANVALSYLSCLRRKNAPLRISIPPPLMQRTDGDCSADFALINCPLPPGSFKSCVWRVKVTFKDIHYIY